MNGKEMSTLELPLEVSVKYGPLKEEGERENVDGCFMLVRKFCTTRIPSRSIKIMTLRSSK